MVTRFVFQSRLQKNCCFVTYLGRAIEIFKLSHCDCMYFDFVFLVVSCVIPVVFLKYTIKKYHSQIRNFNIAAIYYCCIKLVH
jgi:hypothetical protein